MFGNIRRKIGLYCINQILLDILNQGRNGQMRIKFRLADIEIPVNDTIIKAGNVEAEVATDEHDTGRMTAMMEKGPGYIKELVGVIREEILPLGELVGEFVYSVQSTMEARRAQSEEANCHDRSDKGEVNSLSASAEA